MSIDIFDKGMLQNIYEMMITHPNTQTYIDKVGDELSWTYEKDSINHLNYHYQNARRTN